ncbi:alpha-amylase family glycosyl hydrolase [Streptococcus iniae]|uniref:Alpha-amylase n=1 Tax=Streptococcus iniae TaxID=1346 RepID=A0A3L8GM80_STRIN|nr:alpha-amylase family glycosyl hydrolase [Streptococcus iniae]AGM98512.1 alpha-amylase [Streptococcus iniae SF1]AHY15547.1 alpha-amylase [Streptococcus iniae]AHY17415.1 alpha-amylase [Streptococcus iniae]AJG25721.1 alpha-amylase [Streptococcus iniae]APD31592.1 alpha-amylase [Streptococcus iniae]
MKKTNRKSQKWLATSLILLGLASAPLTVSATENASVTTKADFSTDTIYQIITDRFKDGNPSNNGSSDVFDKNDLKKYHGGDWQGIIEKINDNYLTDMGITAIWISSPVENIDSIDPSNGSAAYHGYWAKDFFKTNKHFGTEDDFKQLIEVAHAKNIKVVIDFAPNHTSTAESGDTVFPEDGALYKNGNKLGGFKDDKNKLFNHEGWTNFQTSENSIYHSMYGLADLNNSNPTVDTYMKEAIDKWLDMGIDGIRVDAVKHMSQGWQKNWLSHIYEKHNVFTFGEWFSGHTNDDFDMTTFANNSGMGLLDFRFANAVRSLYTGFSAFTMTDFYKVLENRDSVTNEVNDQVTFIDNHDMERFATKVNNNQTAINQAYALLLTSRGVPNIYYGSEQYATGDKDPNNRGDMPSFDKTVAYQIISKLAPLRKTNPALSYGTTEQRWINDDVLVFERKFGNNVALVAINRNQTNVFTIDNMKTSLPAGKHEDVLGKLMKGNSLTVSQSGDVETFELQPGEVAVWSSMKSSEHPQLGDVDPSMGISGNELTLVGQGFGSSKGQVNFGAIQAEVLSWSDTMIKIKIPEMAAGYYDISVKAANGQTSNVYKAFEVLTGKQVPIRLMVNHFETSPGEQLYLLGDVFELGANDSKNAIGPIFNDTASIAKYPNWFYDVNLPINKDIHIKLVKKNSNGEISWTSPETYTIRTNSEAQTITVKN